MIKEKGYYFLLVAQFFSTIGDSAYYFIISLFIFEATKQNASLGVLTIMYTLPAILLVQIAGGIADKFSRKKIMVFTDVLRAIILFIMPFTKDLWLIYFLVFLEQSFTVLFSPAVQASIPQIVQEDMLLKANSWLSGVRSVAKVLGSAIGGIFFIKFGTGSVFWLDSFSFVISFLCILSITIKEKKYISTCKIKLPRFFSVKELAEIYQISTSNTFLKYLLVNYAFVAILGSLISTFLVTYSKEVLNSEGSVLSILMTIQSVGAIAGSVFFPTLLKEFSKLRLVRFSHLALTFYCIIPLCIIFFPNIAIATIFLLLFGAAEVYLGIVFQTIVQSDISNQWHGRVFSIQSAIYCFMNLVSGIFGGLLIDKFNIKTVFVASGMMVIPISITIIYLFEKKARLSSLLHQKEAFDTYK